MGAFALIYLTLYLLSALICGVVAIYAWQRQTVRGAMEYSLLAFSQTAAIIFFIIEILSLNKEAKLFWDQLQWLTTALLPVVLLWFALRYTGFEIRRPRLFWPVVMSAPALFMLATITNRWHGLVIGVSWVRVNWPFSELVYSFTPLDEILFGYLYLAAGVSIGILILRARSLSYPGKHQTGLLTLAVSIPCLAGMGILFGFQIGPLRDYSAFAYALGNLVAWAGLYRMHLFDLTPIARDLLVENLPDEVIVIDARNRLVYLNAVGVCRLEQPKEVLIGQFIDVIYSEWPALLERLHHPSETNAFTVLTPSGETRAYQLRATPLPASFRRAGGQIILINDVTHLIAAEAELVQHRQYLARLVSQRTSELQRALDERQQALNDLQASKKELEQRVAERTAELAAQNRELETFAYSVSHDLKTPLRGIDGYSRLLMDDYGDRLDADGLNFLNNIRQATAQMYRLIEDLLQYSRFQRRALSYQAVDTNRFINALLSEFENEIKQRKVLIGVQIECPQLYAEVEGLSQALRNLIDNALKFTRTVPEPRIEVGVAQTADGCRLWVKDNGIGFDMVYQDRIFEIFQRLHRAEEYPGTGVGLALVQTVAQRMGGRTWAESAPGCGATFYIQLPSRTIAAPMVK